MHQDIICGNCFELLPEILTQIDNPVIVTDPPFNVGYHYGKYKDKKPEDTYYKDLASIFMLAPSVVIHYPENLHRLSIEMKEPPLRVVSWVYPSNTAKQHRDIAFYRIKPDFNKVRQPYKNMNDKRVKKLYEKTGGAKLYDWIECNQVKNVSKEKTEHPCQMPFELMNKIIGILPDNITIIDPFAGSGTTLLAAMNSGKDFVGIEYDENYVEIINDRINNFKECV